MQATGLVLVERSQIVRRVLFYLSSYSVASAVFWLMSVLVVIIFTIACWSGTNEYSCKPSDMFASDAWGWEGRGGFFSSFHVQCSVSRNEEAIHLLSL